MAKKQKEIMLKYPQKGWAKGLTKETDARVMNISIALKGKKYKSMSIQEELI